MMNALGQPAWAGMDTTNMTRASMPAFQRPPGAPSPMGGPQQPFGMAALNQAQALNPGMGGPIQGQQFPAGGFSPGSLPQGGQDPQYHGWMNQIQSRLQNLPGFDAGTFNALRGDPSGMWNYLRDYMTQAKDGFRGGQYGPESGGRHMMHGGPIPGTPAPGTPSPGGALSPVPMQPDTQFPLNPGATPVGGPGSALGVIGAVPSASPYGLPTYGG